LIKFMISNKLGGWGRMRRAAAGRQVGRQEVWCAQDGAPAQSPPT